LSLKASAVLGAIPAFFALTAMLGNFPIFTNIKKKEFSVDKQHAQKKI
jgi:hypothetical protein